MQIERRDIGLTDIKLAGGSDGTFSGYGATFGNVDSYGDTIRKGAFARTLKEWGSKGKLPKMLLQHGGMGVTSDDMMPVGKWLHMEETAKGLHVEGKLFALNTERGQYIYEGLKAGELDSLSIGYQVPEGGAVREKSVAGAVRALIDVDLWEVSIVTFPADKHSLISGVKMTPDQLRELEGSLRDGGLSQREAVIASSVLKKWLQRDAGVPIIAPRDEVAPEEAAILAALEKLSDQTWSAVFKR